MSLLHLSLGAVPEFCQNKGALGTLEYIGAVQKAFEYYFRVTSTSFSYFIPSH